MLLFPVCIFIMLTCHTLISHANLFSAKLLYNTSLYCTNLQNAILSNAVLSDVYLSNAVPFPCSLSNTIISNSRFFDDIILDSESDFDGSIIDDSEFIKYLQKKSCQNIPNIIRNKIELKEKMLEKDTTKGDIRYYILKRSKLSSK